MMRHFCLIMVVMLVASSIAYAQAPRPPSQLYLSEISNSGSVLPEYIGGVGVNDLDGDGFTDIVYATYGAGVNAIFVNEIQRNDQFTNIIWKMFGRGNGVAGITTGNFRSTTRKSFVVIGLDEFGNGQAWVYEHTGQDNNYNLVNTVPLNFIPKKIARGDGNSNGKEEFIVSGRQGSNFIVVIYEYSPSTSSFVAIHTQATPQTIAGMADDVSDVDHDNNKEIILSLAGSQQLGLDLRMLEWNPSTLRYDYKPFRIASQRQPIPATMPAPTVLGSYFLDSMGNGPVIRASDAEEMIAGGSGYVMLLRSSGNDALNIVQYVDVSSRTMNAVDFGRYPRGPNEIRRGLDPAPYITFVGSSAAGDISNIFVSTWDELMNSGRFLWTSDNIPGNIGDVALGNPKVRSGTSTIGDDLDKDKLADIVVAANPGSSGNQRALLRTFEEFILVPQGEPIVPFPGSLTVAIRNSGYPGGAYICALSTRLLDEGSYFGIREAGPLWLVFDQLFLLTLGGDRTGQYLRGFFGHIDSQGNSVEAMQLNSLPVSLHNFISYMQCAITVGGSGLVKLTNPMKIWWR